MNVTVTGGGGRQCLAAVLDFVENDDVEKIILVDISGETLEVRKGEVNSSKIETHVMDITDTGKLAEVMEGDLDAVVGPLRQEYQADQLAALAD